ncbi:acyl-CoA dehydrogenase family protein [Plantibacter sp. ME-Dv--P-095]|uniref:acyl-CoA dehydrogenase family protein n=1 Tax=Plantibacter sp. ME-Dv--P-095 TaxID=3040299 RepID=UPI002551170C|nr:acyl-CoA dehydrogenase family protein [Plantibacter sp. ME-Dv--P-095]
MSATTVDRDLVARFAPLFDELGRGAVERERERRLPYAEVEALREAGFTRVTLPREHGGDAATHGEFFELLAELARRDPNLAQLFRSHFSYLDRTLHAPASADREARLARLADGAVVGNASHERSTAKVGSLATRLTETPEGLRLNGTKFYSTGTLFADLVGVAAEQDGEFVSVLVDTGAPGVDRIDDWTGFGQRLTGSGTTVFTDVAVDPSTVVRREPDRPSHGGAFVQLVLLAAVTGIGRAIVDDAAGFVRARTRTYSHGAASTAQGDPIVQEVVGELSAKSFAADAALAAATTALERSSSAILDGDPERIRAQLAAVELATARAQLVILPAVLDAATALFDVGGASAVETHLALDRHWRNARTIASHNPARFKARAIGDHLVNGTPIVSWWSTGEA